LYLTSKGEELKRQLMAPQIERFKRALSESGRVNEQQFRSVLLGMIDAEGRKQLQSLPVGGSEQ
jgi:hypothetical protein